jgi:hypothetical protein
VLHRLSIALVTLLGLTAASVVAGYVLLSGATDRLAGLAPSSAAAYVNVYLRPSAGQQMNLAELIGRLPGFADAASLDAKVDQIVGNLLSGTGIDYAADLKPWLGDQLAIAAWPDGTSGETTAVVLLSVKDRPAAEEAVPGIIGSESSAPEIASYRGAEIGVATGGAYTFLDGAVVIGPTAESLHPIVDVSAGADALAERSGFATAMSRLPADHLASAFVDVAAFGGANGSSDATQALGAALVAEPAGLRITGSIPAEGGAGVSGGASELVDWIPEDALAAAVVFGLPDALDGVESALGGSAGGEEVLGLLDTIRALAAFGLGLDLDADVLPLLDREAAIALTSLDGGVPRGILLTRPTDPTTAAASLDVIVGRLADAGATIGTETRDGNEITTLAIPDLGDVAYAIRDDVIVLGFTPDDVAAAIAAHAGDATLGASGEYRDVFAAAGGHDGSRAFVDIGALVELGLLDEVVAGLPDDARDILSQLGAFGISIPAGADSIDFHAAITVPDRGAE